MTDSYPFSWKPSDATSGTGGMIPEGVYTFKVVKTAVNTYNETVIPGSPSIYAELVDDNGVVYRQHWSAGDIRNLEPTPDGKTFKPATKAAARLNTSTLAYALMKSLANAHFPEDKLTDDISVLVGLRVKIIHEETPEREIGGRKVAKKMIPVVGEIIAMPDEKGKTKVEVAAPTGSGKTEVALTAKKPNGSESGITDKLKARTIDVLINILKKDGNGNPLEKKQITRGIYNTIPVTDTDRAGMLNLVILDPFLSSLTDYGIIFYPDKGAIEYMGN